ncbi:chain length determinant family protein [Planococcus antarcticus DSM 14505]|uniref:Chain length determinant family protein n=1 Tax=Planococcus antarcticus DSM 14505 TaxID=1185653 RepID=A0A1C7DFH9_9BACL|nr:Wzz/FepE/Etk N-terminal domain-containing protein [Planococcus antarcticus]ANU10246.1 chain-length determining protein [Planococcus antarcticus DSM 14505]EIM07153.1 chain length determinant family protein [Planococcus antarcticus DSM 14505]
MESTFNLNKFLKAMQKRKALIILVTLAFIVFSAVASYTIMKPVYKATTQILINQNTVSNQDFDSLDIDTNLQLIGTYNVIIKSPAILANVIEELQLKETVQTLTERTTVNNIESSQVVSLSVEDSSMEQAVLIANTTAKVFQEEIQQMMKVDNVSILAAAETTGSPKPIRPDPIFNMAIGAIVGLVFGMGITLILEQLNTTVRSEEDIEEMAGLRILGVVSPVDSNLKMEKPLNLTDRLEKDLHAGNEKDKKVNAAKIGGSY